MVDISVNNLTKFFVIGENLLQGLSFEIQEGERVAILGRNGCGKTTLFRILTKEIDYDEGEVYVNPNKRLGLISQIPISRRATMWRMYCALPIGNCSRCRRKCASWKI